MSKRARLKLIKQSLRDPFKDIDPSRVEPLHGFNNWLKRKQSLGNWPTKADIKQARDWAYLATQPVGC